jgi:hypothetical protein
MHESTVWLSSWSAASPGHCGSFGIECGGTEPGDHHARIIVGNGTFASGSIIVRGGKIASVSAGSANIEGLKVIDAQGMSAMPGFIDAHKHISTGPQEKEQMQSLLEAGYTTILSGGGPGDGNMTLREHIESGMIKGPRIIPSERI